MGGRFTITPSSDVWCVIFLSSRLKPCITLNGCVVMPECHSCRGAAVGGRHRLRLMASVAIWRPPLDEGQTGVS